MSTPGISDYIIEDGPKVLNIDFPASQLFSFLGLINLALIYAKLSVHLYIPWMYIFVPTAIFFLIKLLESILLIRNLADRKQLVKLRLSVSELKLKALWAVS